MPPRIAHSQFLAKALIVAMKMTVNAATHARTHSSPFDAARAAIFDATRPMASAIAAPYEISRQRAPREYARAALY